MIAEQQEKIYKHRFR